MYKQFYLILITAVFYTNGFAQIVSPHNNFDSSSIIAAGADLQLVSARFTFTEGPATDKKGNVFFTDQPDNKIWKYDINGELSLFMDSAGRANGMYFDHSGNLLACADEQNQLWSITPDGLKTVLLTELAGKHFNGPNDLWIHPNENIYFTDPYYQRSYWTRTAPELPGMYVYLYTKGKTPVAVATDLEKPNGIIGTTDGKYLYVADIKASKTYRYDIMPDGSLGSKMLFANQGSDGMTIDEKGNIYLSGKGITVFDPTGKMIQYIPVPGDWTGNLTFGGKDRNVLFITASKAVFVLKMKVKG